jgi:hypothetical protein
MHSKRTRIFCWQSQSLALVPGKDSDFCQWRSDVLFYPDRAHETNLRSSVRPSVLLGWAEARAWGREGMGWAPSLAGASDQVSALSIHHSGAGKGHNLHNIWPNGTSPCDHDTCIPSMADRGNRIVPYPTTYITYASKIPSTHDNSRAYPLGSWPRHTTIT